MPIPDELEAHIRRLFVDQLSDVFELAYTEIQEDDDGTPYSYDNLLIGVIPKGESTKEQIKRALARAKNLLKPLFTDELGRWSWMIVVSLTGKGDILASESAHCDFPGA
jgi:hypothetical protein